jgi:hypothetical protein
MDLEKVKKRTNKGKRFLAVALVLLACLIGMMTSVLIWYQDQLVQKLLADVNENFNGALIIEDTNIEPFQNFPYISIAIKNVQVYEDKEDMFAPILDVSDISLGLNFWSLIKGDVEVNMLRVENGNFDIYRYADGSFNLMNALAGRMEVDELKEEYNIELKKIELLNLDIIKYDESTRYHVETYIEHASSRFRNTESLLMIGLESQLLLNVISDGDSTFLTHKRFSASTQLDYDRQTSVLSIQPTEITLKNSVFNLEGEVDVDDEFNVDIDLHGNNPDFSLLIALAPQALIPTLEQYENAGKISFEAKIAGKTLSGAQPAINATFSCDSAYFSNPTSKKQLEEISFSGSFTNGASRDFTTMEFHLENMTAKPEAGTFEANLSVVDFEAPEIDLTINSNFNLDFLVKFLNITDLREVNGDVSLEMRFRDIVDLQNPEKSLEEFNKSYFSELNVEDLTFFLPNYHLKFDSIDLRVTMDGNQANIEYLFMNIGNSDITLHGDIDDLPAIVHQTNDSIQANLFMFSSLLDVEEMTSGDTLVQEPVREKLENLRIELSFATTPRHLFNAPNLPAGSFFINNLYAKPQNYPHTFKRIGGHVVVDDDELKVVDLHGKIDASDFSYSGSIDNYPILMNKPLKGSIDVDFALKSDLLQLDDLFTYNGTNYLPPDYRKEEFSDLKLYGNAELEFVDSLVSTEIFFDQLGAKLKVHEMTIEDIHGKFNLNNESLELRRMAGKVGKTDLSVNARYYLGINDSIGKTINKIEIWSEYADFDQLSNYSEIHNDQAQGTQDYDTVFNIYTLPFTDLALAINIGQLNYHKHLVSEVNADLRLQKNHLMHVDTLRFYSSGGAFDISGYFDGSNADSIFFYPEIKVAQVNLEEMLYRFDNFGQDYIISDNLSGRLSGEVRGKVHVHADLVPILNNADLFLDFMIVDGSLRNYKPMNALAEYFTDKNLSNIRFDTLSNQLEIKNGVISIPKMTINSSLGFMDISGSQNFDSHMEYYIRVPLKLVSSAAWKKLFGKRKNVTDSTNIDAIQYKNDKRKYWYVNLMLEGTPDNYSVRLGKRQKKKG